MGIALIGKVLLTILKVVLFLFLFFLLVIIVALVVPVRYEIRAERYEELLFAGKVSWLLGIIKIAFLYKEGEFNYKLRLFWTDYSRLSTLFNRKKDKRYGKKSSDKAGKDSEDVDEEIVSKKAADVETAERQTEDKDVAQKETADKQIENKGVVNRRNTDEAVDEKAETEDKYMENSYAEESYAEESYAEEYTRDISCRKKKISLFRKVKEIINKIKSFFVFLKKCVTVFKDKTQKAARVKTFIFSENTKDIICVVRDNVLHLWKQLKPRKIKSEILFGTGDPCSTGEALGIAAVFMTSAGQMINITPDFENEVLRGKLEISGHICIFTFIRVITGVIASKEWKRFYKEAMKIKEEL